jgi:hypothetical protein
MQGIVNVVQVRDFEIIAVYKFMSIVFAFMYISVQEMYVGVWTVFMWLRIRAGGGLL